MALFDVQSGVQSGIRIGECVFPLCETAESFPEGSLSADFPAAIVPQDVRCGNTAGTLQLGRKWIIVLRVRVAKKRRSTPLPLSIYSAAELIIGHVPLRERWDSFLRHEICVYVDSEKNKIARIEAAKQQTRFLRS